jgi:hypothetical protein
MVRFEARPLLNTSKEARIIALREAELLPFNTAFDILYIENSTLESFRATLHDNDEIPEWILRIEHIAVPFGDAAHVVTAASELVIVLYELASAERPVGEDASSQHDILSNGPSPLLAKGFVE